MSSLLILLLLSLSCFSSKATVPESETFQFVNEGEFGPFVVEYDGNYRALNVFSSPFQLCFYNTTPNSYTLALRMALTRSESLFRWVWEANRGNPVRENATLTFGTNGNLVLANPDGKIAWQTNTANKGVVGFKLLANGNMVLHDSKGKFIWQSFDYPTDTLLAGQSLKIGGPNKLVSRASAAKNVNGLYSLALEPTRFAMYRKNVLYYSSLDTFNVQAGSSLESMTLNVAPETDEGFAYEITLGYKLVKSSDSGTIILARPKYNATLSILRLGIDGNLKVFTYYDPVDYRAWEETFTLFDRENTLVWEPECQLPERCGTLGVCEDNQCVACPSPKGLLGWSKKCGAKKVGSCAPKDFGYYKVEGVDHFMSKFNEGEGPMKESDCGKKCTLDCKCLGYFYHKETSKCWIAYDLMTLTKVSNSSHVGYIKTPITSVGPNI